MVSDSNRIDDWQSLVNKPVYALERLGSTWLNLVSRGHRLGYEYIYEK